MDISLSDMQAGSQPVVRLGVVVKRRSSVRKRVSWIRNTVPKTVRGRSIVIIAHDTSLIVIVSLWNRNPFRGVISRQTYTWHDRYGIDWTQPMPQKWG
jgi:hypothetical protein